jgi:hypothetical protein
LIYHNIRSPTHTISADFAPEPFLRAAYYEELELRGENKEKQGPLCAADLHNDTDLPSEAAHKNSTALPPLTTAARFNQVKSIARSA